MAVTGSSTTTDEKNLEICKSSSSALLLISKIFFFSAASLLLLNHSKIGTVVIDALECTYPLKSIPSVFWKCLATTINSSSRACVCVTPSAAVNVTVVSTAAGATVSTSLINGTVIPRTANMITHGSRPKNVTFNPRLLHLHL